MTVGGILINNQLVIKHTLPNHDEMEEQNILDEHENEKFKKQGEYI